MPHKKSRSDSKPVKQQMQRQDTSFGAAKRLKDSSTLLQSTPAETPAVRKLIIKLRTSAPASPQPETKQSVRLKFRSQMVKAANPIAQPSAPKPLGLQSVKTNPIHDAKRCKAALVERPITRRFKLQQHAKLKVRLKLKNLTQPKLTQRKSTLTHQQKRHGSSLLSSAVKQGQWPSPQEAKLLLDSEQAPCGLQSLPAAEPDMAGASAAGAAAALEARQRNLRPIVTYCATNAAGAAGAAADTTLSRALQQVKAKTAPLPGATPSVGKAVDAVVLCDPVSCSGRAVNLSDGNDRHRSGVCRLHRDDLWTCAHVDVKNAVHCLLCQTLVNSALDEQQYRAPSSASGMTP